jgi:hypothetical protein
MGTLGINPAKIHNSGVNWGSKDTSSCLAWHFASVETVEANGKYITEGWRARGRAGTPFSYYIWH